MEWYCALLTVAIGIISQPVIQQHIIPKYLLLWFQIWIHFCSMKMRVLPRKAFCVRWNLTVIPQCQNESGLFHCDIFYLMDRLSEAKPFGQLNIVLWMRTLWKCQDLRHIFGKFDSGMLSLMLRPLLLKFYWLWEGHTVMWKKKAFTGLNAVLHPYCFYSN